MRFIYFLFLIVFAGAVAVFAFQNQDAVPLRFDVGFFQWSETINLALLVGVTYLLGMLSGWTVVGMLRRSLGQVAHDMQHRHPAGGPNA
jgi:lipopolysaccharide assembly protein A